MDVSQLARDVIAVTPNDTADVFADGFVYSGGAVTVVTAEGQTRLLDAAFAGIVFPCQIVKVKATGTDEAAKVVVFVS